MPTVGFERTISAGERPQVYEYIMKINQDIQTRIWWRKLLDDQTWL